MTVLWSCGPGAPRRNNTQNRPIFVVMARVTGILGGFRTFNSGAYHYFRTGDS